MSALSFQGIPPDKPPTSLGLAFSTSAPRRHCFRKWTQGLKCWIAGIHSCVSGITMVLRFVLHVSPSDGGVGRMCWMRRMCWTPGSGTIEIFHLFKITFSLLLPLSTWLTMVEWRWLLILHYVCVWSIIRISTPSPVYVADQRIGQKPGCAAYRDLKWKAIVLCVCPSAVLPSPMQ